MYRLRAARGPFPTIEIPAEDPSIVRAVTVSRSAAEVLKLTEAGGTIKVGVTGPFVGDAAVDIYEGRRRIACVRLTG